MDFGVYRSKAFDKAANFVDPGVVDIKCDAANTRITGVKSLSGSCFNDVVNQFTLLEEVQERRKAAQIQGARSCVQQVILNPH